MAGSRQKRPRRSAQGSESFSISSVAAAVLALAACRASSTMAKPLPRTAWPNSSARASFLLGFTDDSPLGVWDGLGLGLGWVGLGWVGLGWVGLGWVGLVGGLLGCLVGCLLGLGWVGLGLVGLGWVGFGWVGLGLVGFVVSGRLVGWFSRLEGGTLTITLEGPVKSRGRRSFNQHSAPRGQNLKKQIQIYIYIYTM